MTRIHEEARSHSGLTMGSNRSFGIVFFVVFLVIGLWPMIEGNGIRYWSVGIAFALLSVTVCRPSLFGPANKIWFEFGLFLARITNPVFMGVIFYVAVVPTALMMRLAGKDILRTKIDKEAASYWIVREPPGPDPQTMKRQF